LADVGVELAPFGDTWFQVMDDIDLAEMFERASANRRIALPRSAIATQIFERTVG
jgi:hypothetical protein